MTEYTIKTKTAEKCRVYPDSPYGLQPSVTSITGCLMKYALVDWAANCAVDFILKYTDKHGKIECTQVIVDARTAYKQISETAVNTGTDIHELCALWLTQQDSQEAESKATPDMLALFKDFKKWCGKNKIEVVHSEIVLHGDGYSGRCDLIAYRTDAKTENRVLGLYDIKTGKNSYYPEWALQISAYAQAFEDNKKNEKECYALQEIGIIKLNKETLKCNFKAFTNDRERLTEAFMHLKDFYWAYNDLKTQFIEIEAAGKIKSFVDGLKETETKLSVE